MPPPAVLAASIAATSAALTLDRRRMNGNTAGGFGGGIANGVPLPPGGPPLFGGAVTLTHSQDELGYERARGAAGPVLMRMRGRLRCARIAGTMAGG